MCCAAFTGCGGNREVDNRLSKAYALMTDAPDSALSILTGICPEPAEIGFRYRGERPFCPAQKLTSICKNTDDPMLKKLF